MEMNQNRAPELLQARSQLSVADVGRLQAVLGIILSEPDSSFPMQIAKSQSEYGGRINRWHVLKARIRLTTMNLSLRGSYPGKEKTHIPAITNTIDLFNS